MKELQHYGVKGQRWGVRRFQNKDGTRTSLGKQQLKAVRKARNEEGIRQVYRSLGDKDFDLLDYSKEDVAGFKKDDFKDLGQRHTIYDQYNRVRYDKNGDAVGYIAATGFKTSTGQGKAIVNKLSVDLAVSSNHRGKGYGSELAKDFIRWYDKHGSKDYDLAEWYAREENIASQKAAERAGFKRLSKSDEPGWVGYEYSRKQTEFKKATSSVTSKCSNKPNPIQKEKVDISKVMDRGKVSERDARTCAKLADKVFEKAKREEPKITNDLISLARSSGSKMYGLDHRLKQPTSIAGKIGSDSKDDGVSYMKAASGIKDAVRYTTVTNDKNFVKNYNTVKSGLEKQGYQEVKCKNYFEMYRNGEVQHKAVQSTYRTPNGYDFEIQFQTPQSQAAKELKIPIYEERRKQGIDTKRATELEQAMHDLAEQVPYPKGISEIKSHK